MSKRSFEPASSMVQTCSRFLLLFVSSASAYVAACSPADPAFDPRGSALRLYGEWDVNGLAPNAAICARAKIDTVALVWTDDTGAASFTSPAFTFPCSDGYYDSTSAVLRRGTLGYRWIASYQGVVVLESQHYDAVESAGPNGPEVQVMAVDFLRRVDVRIDARLAFDTGTGFGTCAAALSDTMSWELRLGGVTGALMATSGGSFPCAEIISIADVPVGSLVAGDYTLTVHAAATDGALWATDCTVHVYESGPSAVTCDVPRAP